MKRFDTDYIDDPGPQGEDVPGCIFALLRGAASVAAIVLMLASPHPMYAQNGEPGIGPAPCHSDTPWGCFEYRLYLPTLTNGDVVGDNADPEVAP